MSDNFGGPRDESSISSEEKLLALFSHLSLFLGGILLPLIFWLTNKDKSKFVTFHSLQALWFHVAYVFVIVFGVILVVFAGVGVGLLTADAHSKTMPPIMLIVIIAFYGFLFLIIFGGIGYSIFMAVKSYQGNLNKYPVIGKLVYNKVYTNV
jgi:uncharacterized Tic20 family protein